MDKRANAWIATDQGMMDEKGDCTVVLLLAYRLENDQDKWSIFYHFPSFYHCRMSTAVNLKFIAVPLY